MLGFILGALVGSFLGIGGLLVFQWQKDIDEMTGGKVSPRDYDRGWADGYEVANTQHTERRRQAGIKAGQTRKLRDTIIGDA